MILNNLFSRRHKKENGLFPDVFSYEPMPSKLKITLYKIFERAFDKCYQASHQRMRREEFYERIHDVICEEHSFHCLHDNYSSYSDRVINFFNNNKDTLIDLDILNMVLDIIVNVSQANGMHSGHQEKLLSFIDEINQRMLEHGFGYQYENKLLIRIDSKHTHSEIIKPALQLLYDKRFKNADDEFRKAFEAYKDGKYEEAIREANNSFESTMKIICNLKKYGLPSKHHATALIEHLKVNEFVPNFQSEVFNGLAKCLESVSTIRNNIAGHGQGHEVRKIEESIVSYVLNMTASTIKMLVEINDGK